MPQFNPEDLLEPSPPRQGGFNPEDLVPGAQQVAAEVFKANFDPENSAPAGLRLSLSRGDNLQEKRLRVQKVFPQGDVKVLPKSLGLGTEEDALLYRESPESQWKLVEPPGFDITDIGELIAPSAESIAAETGVAVATGGGSIPATVLRQAIGAFAGEAAEQGIQSIRGVQAQTPGEIAIEPLVEGLFSAAGGFAVSPLVAAGNIVTGRGALQVGEEGLGTINAAKQIDAVTGSDVAKKLTPGLVTDNPALQLQERQSAALLPGLQRRYRDLVDTLDKAIKGNVNPSAFSKITTRVTDGFQKLNNAFIRRLGVKSSKASTSGKAIQEGIEEYDAVARTITNNLYDQARKIEEPQFDFAGLEAIATDLRAGAKGTIDPRVDALLRQIEGIEGPIPITDGVVSVADQLRNVRTGAYAVRNIEPGAVATQATGQANDLFKVLNDTLDNPVNSSPEFVQAWRKASNAARERLTTLEKAAVVKAAKSQNPAELLSLAKPGQVDNLKTLRDTIDPARWREFTDGFNTSLLNDPAKLSATLDSFDKETLDVLIPRVEQPLWRKIGKELSRVADVGVEETAERQIRNKNFIGSIIQSANPRRTSTIIRAVNETNNKGMKDSLRAGVFDWTWDGIVTQGKNNLNINQPLLRDRIAQLKDSGLWSFLPKQDRSLLANTEVVSRAFRRVIDAGTSIQAAEAAKNISRLQKGAIQSFVQAGIISHFYLSPAGRRIMIGSGLPNSRGPVLRALGGALAQVSNTEDISQLEQQ